VAPNTFYTKGLKKVPDSRRQAAFTEAFCPYPLTSPRRSSSQGTFEPPHIPVLPALAVPGPSFSHSISTPSEVPTPAPVEDRDEDIPDAPPPDSNSDPDSEPESEPSIVEERIPFPDFPRQNQNPLTVNLMILIQKTTCRNPLNERSVPHLTSTVTEMKPQNSSDLSPSILV
jgi:hypothetical protein